MTTRAFSYLAVWLAVKSKRTSTQGPRASTQARSVAPGSQPRHRLVGTVAGDPGKSVHQ